MEGLISLLLFAGLFFLMMRFGCGAHNAYGGNEGHGGHGPACRWRGEHGSGLRHARLCGRGLRQDVSGQVLSLLFENLPRQFDVDPRRYLNKALDWQECDLLVVRLKFRDTGGDLAGLRLEVMRDQGLDVAMP